MKTNVVMVSPDRELCGVTIRQDTKSGFLCLTDLQEAYTRERLKKGWHDKRIENILSNKSSAERIYYILSKQGYLNETSYEDFIHEVDKNSLIKTMKKYKAYKTVGARSDKRVICDSYIWVMVALELNPELFAMVIMWVTDKLIINRIEVGDRYNTLARAVAKFDDVDYPAMAKALNWIVFNKHETNLRNKATQEQLKELETLQANLAFSIDSGYIENFDDLIKTMRNLYAKKYIKGKNPSNN